MHLAVVPAQVPLEIVFPQLGDAGRQGALELLHAREEVHLPVLVQVVCAREGFAAPGHAAGVADAQLGLARGLGRAHALQGEIAGRFELSFSL